MTSPTQQSQWWHRRFVWVIALIVVVVVVVGGGAALLFTHRATVGTASPASITPSPSPSPSPTPSSPPLVTSYLVATLKGDAPRYTSPGGEQDGTVAGSWYGYTSILPVIAQKDGYLQVRLQQRPNQSTAWIPASYATLSTTPYRIVINLSQTKLTLYKAGKVVFSAPPGVGATDDPTPTGHYFVTMMDHDPPSGGYGPFVVATSAHSETIADWEGSGDALIGIHGPTGEDYLIGSAGGHISHGCIRLHIPDLVKLADVLPGSPIDVVN